MENLVRKEMEGVCGLDVPLRVSIETGKSWGEMH
jgi:DNA polymerase I-like protein with 3'-5' exonuclease and polymerase domains